MAFYFISEEKSKDDPVGQHLFTKLGKEWKEMPLLEKEALNKAAKAHKESMDLGEILKAKIFKQVRA